MNAAPGNGPLGGNAAHRGALIFMGMAAAAGAIVAVSVIPKVRCVPLILLNYVLHSSRLTDDTRPAFLPLQRRVETPEHPLKGSLNRRINLFSNLARHTSDPAARPPRRHEETDVYVQADEAMV